MVDVIPVSGYPPAALEVPVTAEGDGGESDGTPRVVTPAREVPHPLSTHSRHRGGRAQGSAGGRGRAETEEEGPGDQRITTRSKRRWEGDKSEGVLSGGLGVPVVGRGERVKVLPRRYPERRFKRDPTLRKMETCGNPVW